jgi:hypothetical protein
MTFVFRSQVYKHVINMLESEHFQESFLKIEFIENDNGTISGQ